MTATFKNVPPGKPTSIENGSAATADHKPELAKQHKVHGKAVIYPNDLLPELSFTVVPLSELDATEDPVRKVTKLQVGRLVKSIERFGFRDPILVGENNKIIDGHNRAEAARKIGLTEVPCIVCSDLTEDDVRVLRIAKNRIQELGEWDLQALKREMVYILEFEPDLTVTGYETPEIDQIIVLQDSGEGKTDPLDELGALPSSDAVAVTRSSDLWLLGDHRILCGNARSLKDLDRVKDGTVISAVFTDHPYNVPVSGHITVGSSKFAEFEEASGEMSDSEYEEFLTITTGNMANTVKPGGVLFLCIDWRHVEVLLRVVRSLGLELINLCVWGKDQPGMGSLYRSQHELVVVAERPGSSHINNIQLGKFGRNRSNLWRYAGATGGKKSAEDDFSLHPTVKPVHLVRDAILDVTAMNDTVLDLFLGSGTTVLAAELSHRACIGIEISPAYVDVAIRRWEKLTGLASVHALTGMTFAEMQDMRAEDCKALENQDGLVDPKSTASDAEKF